jgi:hypothetical protein
VLSLGRPTKEAQKRGSTVRRIGLKVLGVYVIGRGAMLLYGRLKSRPMVARSNSIIAW